MARLRFDNVAGTLTTDLAVGATTLTSANLSRMGRVAAPDYAAVTILDANGDYEIVYVTSHTADSPSATISRAQEGTADVAHTAGATWNHGDTAQDFAELGTQVMVVADREPDVWVDSHVSLGVDYKAALVSDGEIHDAQFIYVRPSLDATAARLVGLRISAAPTGANPPDVQTAVYLHWDSAVALTTPLMVGFHAHMGVVGGTITDGRAFVAEIEELFGAVTKATGFYLGEGKNHAADAWAFQFGDYKSQHMGALAVGGADIDTAPNAAASIDLQATDKALILNRLTTTQRDALTAVEGMTLYNTTTDQLEAYVDSAWRQVVDAGGATFTGAVTLSDGSPAASQAYATALSTGIVWKSAVACAATSNVSLTGEQTIDGVATSTSRVLLTGQTAPAENGIYVTAAGAWSRATDNDQTGEFVGAWVPVSAGTSNSGIWRCTNASAPTVGSTSITFEKLPIASVSADGTSIVATGSVFARGALTGDVTASQGSNTVTVTKLRGTSVSSSSPADGEVLTYSSDSAAWLPQLPEPVVDNVVPVDGIVRGDSAIAASDNTGLILDAISELAGFDVSAAPTTVASGSNGVNVNTFAGSGTLNVGSTTNYPTSGKICVVLAGSSSVYKEITYTGKGATTFTGCTTVSGSGALTTGDQVYAYPSDAGHVLLPGSTEDSPIQFDSALILPNGVRLRGLGAGSTHLQQRQRTHLDAGIAGYYWWHNCSRQLTTTPTVGHGQEGTWVEGLTLDMYHCDWTKTTTINDASGISSGDTMIGLTSRTGILAGDVIRIDNELIIVGASGSGGGNVTGCTRGAHGTTAATHADGASVTLLLNLSTTRDMTSTAVADGHGIALGAPHRSGCHDVMVSRPYGCGYFLDSYNRDRTTASGEGIQWEFDSIWTEFTGLCGWHNADGYTAASAINDGFLDRAYFKYAGMLDIDNAGTDPYSHGFYGQYVFDANGGASEFAHFHGYGNYVAAGNRNAWAGSRVKHGFRQHGSAARIDDVLIADFGHSSTNNEYDGFKIRAYDQRGPTISNLKAYSDGETTNELWGVRIETTSDDNVADFALSNVQIRLRTDDDSTLPWTLASAVADATTTTVVITGTSTSLAAGDVIRVGEETIRVGSVATGGGNTTLSSCVRGWAQSYPSSHLSGAAAGKVYLNGVKLNGQNAGEELAGSITGVIAHGVAIEFDGQSEETSFRVTQSGNSWQRRPSAPPTAGAASKHGYFPQGVFVENSEAAVGAPMGWVSTTAGDPPTWTATANL